MRPSEAAGRSPFMRKIPRSPPFPSNIVLAVGLGLGVLFERYSQLHTVLKLVGAAFLLVLAWRIGTAGRGAADRFGSPVARRPNIDGLRSVRSRNPATRDSNCFVSVSMAVTGQDAALLGSAHALRCPAERDRMLPRRVLLRGIIYDP